MDFLTLAAERYSCRELDGRPVPPELLQKICKAAILAPTAVNRQPFRIFVMESEQAKQAIAESTKFTFGASTFLVLGSVAKEGWVRKFDGKSFADIDTSIAATHMMLEITQLGLGTTWVGYFDAPKLKQLCPALQPYELIAIFPIGYPAENAVPGERHEERKSLEDMTITL